MTEDIKPYPKYKDSGVPWLGEVPEHWEVRPLKHWARINQATLSERTPGDTLIRYVDIGAVGTGTMISAPVQMKFDVAPSRARRIVRPGDTIVSTVRTYLKAVYFFPEVEENLIASTGFACVTPLPEVLPHYMKYVLQSESFTGSVVAESVGIA